MATVTTFQYSVRDKAGKLITGSLEADNQSNVVSRLREMGYTPVNIKEVGGGGMKRELNLPKIGGGKVKLKELAIFARQFATMIDSGLPLLRALTILSEQTESKSFASIITEVRAEVETGQSLSAAMALHPAAFPPLIVNMTRAGEVGGFLDRVLIQIAENYEAEVKLRGKVKAAMTYPVVVFFLSIIMVIGMLIFVVPTFKGLFDSMGGKLPPPTLVLVFLSQKMPIALPTLIVLTIAGFATWSRIKNKEKVRQIVDPIKLKVPVFGSLFQKIALTRFTRNLGTMLTSGVPILQSLDIVADTTGNIVITNAVRDIQESVRSGESLTKPLSEHWVFPSMVVQMLAVGEDTGALDTMLSKIATFYDQEVEATTESLTALIEPLMIAFLGGVVGSMIVALYMPIFKIFDLVSSQNK